MFSKIRASYYLKSKEMIKTHTCFLNLKLNSHIGSCLFPTIFLHQKSKHCKKIKITFLFAITAMALMLRVYFGTDRKPVSCPSPPNLTLVQLEKRQAQGSSTKRRGTDKSQPQMLLRSTPIVLIFKDRNMVSRDWGIQQATSLY